MLHEEGFWEVPWLPPRLPLWVAVCFPIDGSAVAAFVELTFLLTKSTDAFWKLHLLIFLDTSAVTVGVCVLHGVACTYVQQFSTVLCNVV